MNFGRWNFLNEVWMSSHESNKINRNKQSLEPFGNVWKLGCLTFWGKICSPPKKNISSNIAQLVTFQSILGSSIDLTSWQCSIGDMELATWQCVVDNLVNLTTISKLNLANLWNGCQFGNLTRWTSWKCKINFAI